MDHEWTRRLSGCRARSCRGRCPPCRALCPRRTFLGATRGDVMNGFVLLDEVDDGGEAWVRYTHVTAVRVVSYREGSGAEDHLVYALAGGRWFIDPKRLPTRELAEARAAVVAGTGATVWTRARHAWKSLTHRP